MVLRRLLVPAVLLAIPVFAADPATAAGPCGYQAPPSPGPVVSAPSWEQRWLDLGRAHAFSTGGGVRVAIVGTGIDASHPQLGAAVATGWDVTTNKPGARFDCNGHGTALASIVAARAKSGSSLVGVAPAATLVPIRVTDAPPSAERPVTPARLAAGVRQAVALKARVIIIGYALSSDDAGIRAAVADAVRKDVLVVAAVGDNLPKLTFPAAYDGVMGVGAIGTGGLLLSGSAVNSKVDLVAPAENVVAAARRSGHLTLSGTPVAAAVVGGAAALLRAYRPNWTAAQVAQRLTATADGGFGGGHSAAYGFGTVNPYRALTEEAATTGASPYWTPAPAALGHAPPQPQWPDGWRRALAWAGGVGVLLVVFAVLGAAAPVMRRRRPDRLS
ncbi:S8 family serine peptidase [Hamadaea sp. NPDC051192]|uniref:S8 family serine peptidase n=1 Tax=Hamadaea sp. NPDC051192 TaxID=3154940 RepID=UPI00343591C3